MDDWASIDANGRVVLHARTRWRKGAFADPIFSGEVGVAPGRFGTSHFTCGVDHTQSVDVTTPTGMQVVCRSSGGCGAHANGEVMYQWPADCEAQTTGGNTGYVCYGFTLAGTTVSVDTSQPSYEQREQVLPIPLGTSSMTGQIVTPLGLPNGDYDIEWVDWARVVGIQNINKTETCETPQSDNGFGFSVRVRFDGNPNNGPSIDSNAVAFVPRGFAYAQGVNANDADDDPLTYTLPVGDASPFNFEPVTAAASSLAVSNNGQLTISATDTTGLSDNNFDGLACSVDTDCASVFPNGEVGLTCVGGHCMTFAAYLVKVKVSDGRGAISESDVMLSPLTSPNKPPTLDPIGDRTLFADVESCFLISASDNASNSDGGLLPTATSPFSATPMPAGASLSAAFAGGTSGGNCTAGALPCGSGKTCATFKWTPPESLAPFGINFAVTNPGTNGTTWNNIDRLTASEVVRIRITGNQRAPVLREIAGQTVGADPIKVQPVVAETLQFNAVAQDPHADHGLLYDLPLLTCVSGTSCTTPGSIAPKTDITTDVANLIHQGTDGFGRPVGVITLKNPPTAGVWQLTVRVTDSVNGLSDQKVVTISVGTFVNHPPQFRIVPPTEIFAESGAPISFPVEAQDPDTGETVNLTMSNNPSGPTFGGATGLVKVGSPCAVLNDCCVTSGCTVPSEILCKQLEMNQPSTCVDTSTNPVCSATSPCEKAYFSWTPTVADAGMAYVIHFNAADTNATHSLTSTAETIVHVASSSATNMLILGIVPNHGPPSRLNTKVGSSCPGGLTDCGVSGNVPLGMACISNKCVDTAHLVHLYGQAFSGTVSVTLGTKAALNLTQIGTTQLTFNTPDDTIGDTVNVTVTNGSQTATMLSGFQYACPGPLCANVDDTNFEGSNACAFVTAFPGCTNPDGDGDGFSNAQETAGFIDIDCDGTKTGMDLLLPGADPTVRDIYIAYDWMKRAPANETFSDSGWDHRPYQTCKINATNPAEECATVNHIPTTLCGTFQSGTMPADTVVPGSWDRVVQSFGAHSTLSSSVTLSKTTPFSVNLTDASKFLKPNPFYSESIRIVPDDGTPPVAVTCTGTWSSGSPNQFTNCIASRDGGAASAGKEVYVGAKAAEAINLHVLAGKPVDHYWVTTFGPQDPTCTVGGTPVAAHSVNPAGDFFVTKAQNLARTNGLAYHYALFTHFSNCDSCDHCTTVGNESCGSSVPNGTRPGTCPKSFLQDPEFMATGIASVYGPDVIISLGEAGFICTEAWIRQEAGVIMHELGHNLSLQHGGDETKQNKQNYMSTMNYMYQRGGLQNNQVTGSSLLSYSDGHNLTLDEGNLVESAAIPYSPANQSPFWTRVWDPIGGVFSDIQGNSDNIDWNEDGGPDSTQAVMCDGTQDPSVQQCCNGDPGCSLGESQQAGFFCSNVTNKCQEAWDINKDGPTNPLTDHNDWQVTPTAALNLLYQCSNAYLPGAPNCDQTISDPYASPQITHCQNTAELGLIHADALGFGSLPPIAVSGAPQKACLDPTSHGVIPVFIDGQKNFDVTKIVLSTVKLVHAPISNTIACSFQDQNHDGFMDLKCAFRQDLTGLSLSSTKACVTGKMQDTTGFTACFPIQLKNDPLNPCL